MFEYLSDRTSRIAAARQLHSARTSISVEARSTRLLAVMTALTDPQTVEDVSSVVLGTGLEVVEAARGFIAAIDGPRLRVLATSGYDANVRARLGALSLDDDVPLTRAIRLGKPVYLRSAEEYQALYPNAYRTFGAMSATQAHAALPLIHNGLPLGGLGLSFATPTTFRGADRVFALMLAQAAAAALHRARQCDHESRGRPTRRHVPAREEVLSMVAHDLRNPLNLIYGTTQLLSECQLSCEERERLLGVCARSVTRMNRLIEDLLDVTRLESGQLSLAIEAMDARRIVTDLEETFRPQADKQRVQFMVALPANDLVATLDPTRIEQAIGNLISNAFKFTKEGGTVSLELRQTEEGVAFLVRDTGAGIPPEHLPHVFERFWQAKSDKRGIGLGLAIVKGIAEAHGGRVSVISQPGVGSTFQLTVPRSP